MMDHGKDAGPEYRCHTNGLAGFLSVDAEKVRVKPFGGACQQPVMQQSFLL